MKSKSIAYVAVSSAIAVIFAVISAFTPSKVVPLAICSLCYLIAFNKTGWVGGLATIVVTELLTFAFTGVSATLLIGLIMFCPYSIVAYALRKMPYTKSAKSVLRAAIMFVLFSLAAFAIISLTAYTASASFVSLAQKWGVWLVCAAVGLVCVPADYFISAVSVMIARKIK